VFCLILYILLLIPFETYLLHPLSIRRLRLECNIKVWLEIWSGYFAGLARITHRQRRQVLRSTLGLYRVKPWGLGIINLIPTPLVSVSLLFGPRRLLAEISVDALCPTRLIQGLLAEKRRSLNLFLGGVKDEMSRFLSV